MYDGRTLGEVDDYELVELTKDEEDKIIK